MRSQNLEVGATSTEYALVVALIFLVIVAAVTAFGTTVTQLFVADWPW